MPLDLPKPELITFDIFGTVLDWRAGLANALHDLKRELTDDKFDEVLELQGSDVQASYKSYVEITQKSLMNVFKLNSRESLSVAQNLGMGPLFSDSKGGLARLMKVAPCAAISNSDLSHGKQVQEQLGFNLSHWFCAEQSRVYKPNKKFWEWVSKELKTPCSRSWWHVSAYGDYDLEAARGLGLTCVFIPRPHSRRGFSHVQARDLIELADILD